MLKCLLFTGVNELLLTWVLVALAYISFNLRPLTDRKIFDFPNVRSREIRYISTIEPIFQVEKQRKLTHTATGKEM